ncbi:MAG TPA: MaoC family dehydratase [Rhodothermales bacterium]|nr:MaoC family dehydratase [Rhodothermales bacterium]
MPPYSLDTLADFVGKELGVSGWHVVEQARIDAFADVTGDHQWIHVDVERAARESPYGGPIAHGYLTLSLLPALRAEVGVVPEGVAQTINYGLDRVRFLTPVRAGARVRARITLVSAEPKGTGVLVKTLNTVEIEGEDKPALLAETLALMMR